MGERIQKILQRERIKQPLKELKRKYEKAKGRYSKNIYFAEEIDLADAEAINMMKTMKFFRGE